MSQILNNPKKYLYNIYLGGALAAADITVSSIEFWYIMIPTTILVSVYNKG